MGDDNTEGETGGSGSPIRADVYVAVAAPGGVRMSPGDGNVTTGLSRCPFPARKVPDVCGVEVIPGGAPWCREVVESLGPPAEVVTTD